MVRELSWSSVHRRCALMLSGSIKISFQPSQARARPAIVHHDIAFDQGAFDQGAFDQGAVDQGAVDQGVPEPLALASRHVLQTEHEMISLPGPSRAAPRGIALAAVRTDEWEAMDRRKRNGGSRAMRRA
jgi:hypothetical protein